MRSVLHRDRVRVRVVRQDKRGRAEGRIVELIERPKAPIIGRLLQEGGQWLVAPEDRRYGQDILVPRNATAQAKAGQVVVLELTELPSLHTQPSGRVVEVLGEIDDPGMEIEIAVRKYQVPHRFSEAAEKEAAALPNAVQKADLAGRVDLRDVPLVTIDGEDARDFDDAVYCEPFDLDAAAESASAGKRKRSRKASEAKAWRLLVAIADVSHYVKPDHGLDDDAYERATSVYFPRRVIPMLPEKLSNGLCSLNPNEDRLCLVCDMVVSAEGEVHAYQFYPAVMHSQARFTYTEVATILANTRGPEAARRQALVPQLLALHEVYRALLKQRSHRGAVDFETTETQIVCDANGRIEKIVPRTRNEAHRLIEEAMLAANVCAADFIHASKRQALYRVHEGPTPEKRMALQTYLRALGLGVSLSDDPSPGEMQAIASATKDRPDAAQIHAQLLRSMQQAIYTPINSGHFGLAYPAYTHFTSPIRRYPDLLVHRVIKAQLQAKRYALKLPATHSDPASRPDARPPRPGTTAAKTAPKPTSKEAAAWQAAGAHCSANERRADEASRDVEAWLKCRFMREKLGEEFSGQVTAVAAFGLFVTLDALYVEGLVHITELGGEYYQFDEARQELRGERTGVRYAVGSRVRVQVSRVDLDARKIDFRLLRDGDVGGGTSRRSRTEPVRHAEGGASDELAQLRQQDRELKAHARAGAGSKGAKPDRGSRATQSPAQKKPPRGGVASRKRGARKTGR
jgi:ribonuclease R